MTATSAQASKGRVRQVGRVVADIVIANRIDEALVERGTLGPADVRRITLHDVLVDTGASLLCLPIDVIRTLDLPLVRPVDATTAAGVQQFELYEDAQLTVEGRRATVDCIALPEGSPALLGFLPLENLGIEPDLQDQRLRLLPDRGKDTYLLVI